MRPIDPYSYHCGVMDSFCEIVGAGVKPMALSHPFASPEERAEYREYAAKMAGQYGVLLAEEDSLPVTLPDKSACALYILTPIEDDFAAIGITQKFISPLTVQSASRYGAALLADESEEGLRRIFDAARTSQTDFDYLVKSVVTIRRSGWCVRRRIAGWPIDGYSAPVRNRAGAVFAAVTLLQPSGRFADRTVVKLLKDVAMAS